MNLLLESLPDSINVKGIEIPVYTDFRYWMKFNEVLINEMDDEKIVDEMIKLFSDTDLLEGLSADAVIDKVCDFLSCGKYSTEKQPRQGPDTFSFTYDSDYILSAFRQFYQIDLTVEKIHWWTFISLLNAINGDCELKERVRIRGMDVTQIKDAATRSKMRELQKAIALPTTNRILTDEEIGAQLW